MSRKTLLLNSMSGAVLWIAEAVAAFVMSPLMVSYLGLRDYGIWELMVSIVGYMGLLDLGIGPAILRFVAHASGAGDIPQLRRYFSSGFWMLTVSGLFGFVVVSGLGVFGNQVLNIQPGDVPNIGLLFVVFGFVLVVSLPINALTAYLMGLQYNRFLNIVRVGGVIARTFAFYWAMTHYQSANALLIFSAIVFLLNAIECAMFAIWIQFVDGRVSMGLGDVRLQECREIGAYGLKSAVMMATGGAVKRVVPVVLAHAVGTSSLVFYLISLRLVEYVVSFISMLGFPVTAYLANLNAAVDRKTFVTQWAQLCKILQILSFGGPCVLAWMGEPFIRRWMGPEIADGCKWVILATTIPLIIFGGFAGNANRTLLSLGKHGPVAKFSLYLAPVIVAISYPLGLLFGVVGVAAAIGLHTVLQSSYEVLLSCRAVGVSTFEFVLNSARAFVIPLAAMSGTFMLLRNYTYPNTYPMILMYTMAGGFVYLFFVVFVAFGREERADVIRGLRRMRAGE